MSILAKLGKLFNTALKNWWNRDPFRESSVIAYSAIFSLPGLLVLVISIAGYFFGEDAVTGRMRNQIAQTLGPESADQLVSIVKMANQSQNSVWGAILGVPILIIGAIGVFVQLQHSFNTIWAVNASTSKSGIWLFLKTRIFSFGLIISIAFLLLISLIVSSLLGSLSSWILTYWSESLLIIFQIMNIVLSLLTITILFALMFKFLPDAIIKWRSVWCGAFVTSLLFVIGQSSLGFYFVKVNPGSGYGPASTIILILIWTSYSTMIVFFGAEFTKVLSDEVYGVALSTEIADKG